MVGRFFYLLPTTVITNGKKESQAAKEMCEMQGAFFLFLGKGRESYGKGFV